MIIPYKINEMRPCNYSRELIQERSLSSDDDLQTLVDSLKNHTGILHTHLLPLQSLSHQLNCIISIRPVDKLATKLIASGYPTKDFHIKGKSASWGPQAGFICEDQCFSKLENAADECIRKYNQQIQNCIIEKHASIVELVISKERLNELIEIGIIEEFTLNNSFGEYTFHSRAPSNKYYYFEAKKLTGDHEVSYLISYDKKPIRVLASKENGLPLTADYDLFLVAPHISDFGEKDNLPVPDVAHEVFRKRIDLHYRKPFKNHQLEGAYSNSDIFYKKEDTNIGNASERTRKLIKLINTALVGEGEKVIHHNMDATSPATDLAANYPATFALPDKIGRFEKLCVIKNNNELKEFIVEAKERGYYIKVNPLWGEQFTTIRSQRFNNSKKIFSIATR